MSFNAKDMTQGGQIANMRFRMFGQIANIIFYVLFILFWVLCGLMLMYRLSWQTFVNGCVYWWCTTLGPMRDIIRSQPVYTIQYYGQSLEYTSEQILADKYTIWCGEQLDQFRLCSRGFSCYLYRDVLHRQLGAGPPGETAE